MKLDIVKGAMNCLFAKTTIYITDCVMAELEKLGPKFRIALRYAFAHSFAAASEETYTWRWQSVRGPTLLGRCVPGARRS